MRTRAERKAATRAQLLDAAAVLVAAEGVQGATVDAIAAAAGVTSGAFYASFASKRELLQALVGERAVDLSHLSLPEAAARLGDLVVGTVEDNPVDVRLLHELLVEAARDKVLREDLATAVLAGTGALARRLVDEDVRTVLPPGDTALLLQVLVAGTISLRQLLGDRLRPGLLSDAVALLQVPA